MRTEYNKNCTIDNKHRYGHLYNFMLPVYASVYNLANAYADEIRRAVSRELFGQDEGTSDEMLVKQIDALNKKLVDAEACVERAENKAADADKLLQQSKKRENALTSKLETAYAEIDELMQLVPEETEDDLPDEQEALEEETLQPDDEPDVDYGKKLDVCGRECYLSSNGCVHSTGECRTAERST